MAKSGNSHAYLIAKRRILDLLVRKDCRPGDLLPSINCLTKSLKTGRKSVQRALGLLEKEGVLETVHGSGSYLKQLPSSAPGHGKPPGKPSIFADGAITIGTASGKTTIKIALAQAEIEYFGGTWRKIFQEYQRENDGIEIEAVEIVDGDDLDGKIRGGEADIFQISLNLLPPYADSGYIFNPAAAGKIEISADDFFKPLFDTSYYKGTLWGMPLAANTTCLYFNRRYKQYYGRIFPVEGFWDYLGKLERLADGTGGLPLSSSAKSFILNDYILPDIFLHCASNSCCKDFASGDIYGLPDYFRFIERFERYYKNRKIFFPPQYDASGILRIFSGGSSVMALATSAWIPAYRKSQFNFWSIAPLPVEKTGFPKLYGVLNVMSSMTYHPSECLDLLNFLGRIEVQRYFALKGRLVANREACRSLRIEHLDDSSIANLIAPFETGRIMVKKNLYDSDFDSKVLYPEMIKWHSGALTAEEFFMTVKRKLKLFHDAQERRLSFSADRRRISIPA